LVPREERREEIKLEMEASGNNSGTNGDKPVIIPEISGKEQGNGNGANPVKYGRGQHPNSKAALTPTQANPGLSANPAGKPKGTRDRATVLRDLMKVKVAVTDPTNPLKTKKMTLYEAAALGMFLAAKNNGNVAAFKEIQDTLYGPVPAKIEGHMEFSFAALAKQAAEQPALPEYTDEQWEGENLE
jgi:hypothetical protein